jgi:hypothetical protein
LCITKLPEFATTKTGHFLQRTWCHYLPRTIVPDYCYCEPGSLVPCTQLGAFSLPHLILIVCASSFFHQYDKIPEKNNLRQEVFILAHDFRGVSPWFTGFITVGLRQS